MVGKTRDLTARAKAIAQERRRNRYSIHLQVLCEELIPNALPIVFST
jgi:hypothetical protein